MFAARLKDAVDLDSIRDDLASVMLSIVYAACLAIGVQVA